MQGRKHVKCAVPQPRLGSHCNPVPWSFWLRRQPQVLLIKICCSWHTSSIGGQESKVKPSPGPCPWGGIQKHGYAEFALPLPSSLLVQATHPGSLTSISIWMTIQIIHSASISRGCNRSPYIDTDASCRGNPHTHQNYTITILMIAEIQKKMQLKLNTMIASIYNKPSMSTASEFPSMGLWDERCQQKGVSRTAVLKICIMPN